MRKLGERPTNECFVNLELDDKFFARSSDLPSHLFANAIRGEHKRDAILGCNALIADELSVSSISTETMPGLGGDSSTNRQVSK